jgi:hypothetical protein
MNWNFHINNFFPADDTHSQMNIPALIGSHFTGAKNGALFRSFRYMCYFFEEVFTGSVPRAKKWVELYDLFTYSTVPLP